MCSLLKPTSVEPEVSEVFQRDIARETLIPSIRIPSLTYRAHQAFLQSMSLCRSSGPEACRHYMLTCRATMASQRQSLFLLCTVLTAALAP